ncbi:MAG: YbaB/EbfC family nucleoid-associated protein [Armatimonadota bacterium]|nr:YbaB/EbfC family nucleoid-associated protein [Armatimonadota bacterium]
MNPFGKIGDLGQIMKQAQKMLEDTRKVEESLAEERIEASSGGGMVKVVVTGKGEVVEIKIDPQVIDPEDVEMLEDLVVSAVREASEQATQLKTEKMKEITGGMGLPGIF